jgi:hypothetical protein
MVRNEIIHSFIHEFMNSFIIFIHSGDNFEAEIVNRTEDGQKDGILFFSWTPHTLTACDPKNPEADFYQLDASFKDGSKIVTQN